MSFRSKACSNIEFGLGAKVAMGFLIVLAITAVVGHIIQKQEDTDERATYMKMLSTGKDPAGKQLSQDELYELEVVLSKTEKDLGIPSQERWTVSEAARIWQIKWMMKDDPEFYQKVEDFPNTVKTWTREQLEKFLRNNENEHSVLSQYQVDTV